MATTAGSSLERQIHAMGNRTLWVTAITLGLIAIVVALAVSLYRDRSDVGPSFMTPSSDISRTSPLHGAGSINAKGEGDNSDIKSPNELPRTNDILKSPESPRRLPSELPEP